VTRHKAAARAPAKAALRCITFAWWLHYLLAKRRKGAFWFGPKSALAGLASKRQSNQGEKQMSQGKQDQVEGTFHEVKGKVKEKAGQALNKPDLEVEGKTENFGGKVQKKVGQIEEVLEK
jgi:uncharacterized protein YjbJ (UPF0337 family)